MAVTRRRYRRSGKVHRRKSHKKLARRTRGKKHSRRASRRIRHRGGDYASVNDYRSGAFNKATDQLLMHRQPSTYQAALDAANTPVPGVNTVYKGGRRIRRKYRGGNAGECVTWHGAGGPCIPKPIEYNGPYGAIPIHQTAGVYPKQT